MITIANNANDSVARKFTASLISAEESLRAFLPLLGSQLAERFGAGELRNEIIGNPVASLAPRNMTPNTANGQIPFTITIEDGRMEIACASETGMPSTPHADETITPSDKMRRFFLAMVMQTERKEPLWLGLLGHAMKNIPIAIVRNRFLECDIQLQDVVGFTRNFIQEVLRRTKS